ncbi:hypothetical protein QYE76_027374 [Lolium multiflorum]|uniref:Uncharacterized protein n=1 Tax=Lolium multiflorum TaxID=4521 RepID=A0AAD8QK89_LOLMU|nr:hypothetical protein QYE76_027374 [Lolium multiflorum]
MDFGDDQEGGSESQQQQQQRRKRYHRHTPRQIQTLEAMFKECPHPDENQRAQLSRELGLEARQIKFWFQNRRTQMKAQHERADNCFLRAENDKIRCENIAMREALKNVICPTCGGPPVAEDYFDEQKLRMENARLKEELDRVASLTSKFLGRPYTQMPQGMPQMSASSLDLSMGGGHHHHHHGLGLGGPNLDLDLLSGAASSSEMPHNWMEFFPSIVCNARTVDVLVNGVNGRSESLILMYEELHIMTPVLPTRELSFLRYCRQIDQGLWAIADVSADMQRDVHFGAPPRSRRLPSGCLIADMANGYSKVTWVEHMEIEDKVSIGPLFRDIVQTGAAFGAQRWLGALQRACERCASLSSLGGMHADIAGASIGFTFEAYDRDGCAVTAEGRRSMMKLSQRMVSSFCASMTASQHHQWTHMSGTAGNDVCVRVSMHRNGDPGQPNGVVLSAATSVWLPVASDHVFAFVRDESTRSQWDVLTHGNQVQEVSRIPNGANPGNCISLLRGLQSSQNSMLVVQESCTDASGSLVVYSPIDIPAANVVMSGEDPSGIPLLPSGFTIWPDGRSGAGGGASTSAGGQVAGSVVTVAFQILVSSLPSSKLNAESIATVSELINNTVRNLRNALNCG